MTLVRNLGAFAYLDVLSTRNPSPSDEPLPALTPEQHQVLVNARELLLDETKHTVGVYARDAQDQMVEPTSSAACTFCALGAVIGANLDAEEADVRIAAVALQIAAGRHGRRCLPDQNDSPRIGHARVLAIYDTAIRETAPAS